MTHLTIPDKLRNSNHDIEGLYSDCQRVTLTAFAILPMFWSKCSKRTVWIWVNCRSSKKEGDQKRWLKQCRRLYSFAKSASASASNLLVTCRDVSPPSRRSSNLLSTTFISIWWESSNVFIGIAITSKTGYSHFFIVLALEFSRFKIGNLYLWKNFACRDSEARFGQYFDS